MSIHLKYAIDDLATAGAFTVPPSCQGQIVEVSYACSPDYIFEKSFDKCDRSVTIEAYEHPDNDALFEPWNDIPETGARVGIVYESE